MSLETYLVQNYAAASRSQAPYQEVEPDDALDQVIHQNSAIHARKLEILASEIWWRLHIASRNLASLEHDKAGLQDMLNRLEVAANYQLGERHDKGVLYRQLFAIEAEKRSQTVECWRDVANVMRDFLAVWEAKEQSRARAIFLENVGTGTEEPL